MIDTLNYYYFNKKMNKFFLIKQQKITLDYEN